MENFVPKFVETALVACKDQETKLNKIADDTAELFEGLRCLHDGLEVVWFAMLEPSNVTVTQVNALRSMVTNCNRLVDDAQEILDSLARMGVTGIA